jgi:crotonobetainyl-CoA:carnitine CoA-transferase CaiB-like acyl-CoA transferase
MSNTDRPRPLAGIDVLDLGQIFQGPYCGTILSYLGADVVKVERPGGETLRDRRDDGEVPAAKLMNPSKRGVTINLKRESGREVLKDLVREADVLVENFTTGKMAELGVGYEDLKEVNPQLVYGHGSGYGDDGPYTDYPAMDLTIQAMGGVVHTTGYADGPPVKAGPAFADFLGGIHLATGICSALVERERTGEGRYVEVGMYDCIYPALASALDAWVEDVDGVPPRTGNRHSGLAVAPYNVYEAADGYVAIACIAERHWHELVDLMDRPTLHTEDRFATKAKRGDNIDEVDAIVQEWVSEMTKDDIVDLLLDQSIPAAPVQTLDEIVDDPQLEYRGMIHDHENDGPGRDFIPVPGSPIKFAGSDEPDVTPAPRVGEHTDEVLRELAGYTDDEVASLHQDDAL